MKIPHIDRTSAGFISAHIIVIAALVVGVSGVGLSRVYQAQQDKKLSQQTQANGKIASADKLKVSTQKANELQTKDTPVPTAKNSPSTTSTPTKPATPVNNSTTGAVKKAVPATTSPTPATTTPTVTTTAPPVAASTITRPTTAFCAQKDGNSFTNVWLTNNTAYTYQGYEWENGYSLTLPMVAKAETGTPLRNYDSMQIFDVLPYMSKPKWATCSDKAGYIMYYYSVPNSPYTFNVLAEFGHVSLTQP
ncbi:MAG: hypothetical protein JWO35_800 [Candidatus Saccharibacteria bacterium]|nr:hypothetical protein [Candidatus Saccharibacteria bacterium]